MRYGTFLVCGAAILVIMEVLLCNLSMNFPFHKVKKEDHFLYKLAAVVEQEEAPTLLNIGCLDAGLYTLTGIVPSCEYFQTNGIALPEMFQEQSRYITSGQTLFVLSRNEIPENIEAHYNLVSTEKYISGNYDFTYYLFKRK